MKIKYIVGIREVHISSREVEVEEGTSQEEIIQLAENAEEVEFEYCHTMDSDNHVVRELP